MLCTRILLTLISAYLYLQKNALQWTKNPPGSDASDPNTAPAASSATTFGAAEGAEQESGDSTETTAASGENDGV